jgi:hypothetical protein
VRVRARLDRLERVAHTFFPLHVLDPGPRLTPEELECAYSELVTDVLAGKVGNSDREDLDRLIGTLLVCNKFPEDLADDLLGGLGDRNDEAAQRIREQHIAPYLGG